MLYYIFVLEFIGVSTGAIIYVINYKCLLYLFMSFVLNTRKCITCPVHRTVISVEHFAIASAGFVRFVS